MVDHCTRLMVAAATAKPPTAENAAAALRDMWLSYFGAPQGVLVDRGSEFVGKAFVDLVLREMGSRLIYTSVAYPQGNAINESSHRAIEASIRSRLSYERDMPFPVLLRDAVLAYNATPHSAIGSSPFYKLYGFDMTFPGWQAVDERPTEEVRHARLRLERLCSLVRSNMLRDEQLRLSSGHNFSVGDMVVYHMSEYERRKALQAGDDLNSRKYGPQWSLPVKVAEVQERTLKVQHTLGGRKDLRVVPKSKVRWLVGDIPDSLVRQSYGNLGFEPPEVEQGLKHLRFEASESVNEDEAASGEQQLIEKASESASQEGNAAAQRSEKKKRRRIVLLE
eukprot:GHVS01106947.1.p1 GENE.GHVS01106947.1~~GHVS01106947.1.p1  ORF type:complete len:383 (+),score=33.61 GHVS01106947.1:144-1151(+)